jgi:GNAT superfamily N-acetyltransferase
VIDWQTRTVALWSFVDPFTSGSAAGGSSSPPCPVLFATPQTPLKHTNRRTRVDHHPAAHAGRRTADVATGRALGRPRPQLPLRLPAGWSPLRGDERRRRDADGGDLAGFVVAYPPPDRSTDLVFVWQVTVAQTHRGSGLAGRMLHAVIDRAPDGGARTHRHRDPVERGLPRPLRRRRPRPRTPASASDPASAPSCSPGTATSPSTRSTSGPFAAAGRHAPDRHRKEHPVIDIFTTHESEVRSYCRSWPVVFERAKGDHIWDTDGAATSTSSPGPGRSTTATTPSR